MLSYPSADADGIHDLVCSSSIAAVVRRGHSKGGIGPSTNDGLVRFLKNLARPATLEELSDVQKLVTVYTYPGAPTEPKPLSKRFRVCYLAPRELLDLATTPATEEAGESPLRECVIAVKRPWKIHPDDEKGRENSKYFCHLMQLLRVNSLVAVSGCDSVGRVSIVAPNALHSGDNGSAGEYVASLHYAFLKQLIPWARENASSVCATSRSNTASRATKLNVQQQKEATPSVNITLNDAETTPPVNNEPMDAQKTSADAQTTQPTQPTDAQTSGLLRGLLTKAARQSDNADATVAQEQLGPFYGRDKAAVASRAASLRRKGRALQTLRNNRNVPVPAKEPKRLKIDVSITAETKLVVPTERSQHEVPRSLSSMLEKEPASASRARALATCQRILATAPLPVPSNDDVPRHPLDGQWQAPVVPLATQVPTAFSSSSHALVAKKRQISWTENDRRLDRAQQMTHAALMKPPSSSIVPADRWTQAKAIVADLLLEEKKKSLKQRSGGGPISKRLPSAAKRRSDEVAGRAAYRRPPCALLDIFRDDHLASVLIESTSEGLLFDDESSFNEYQRVVKRFLLAFKLYREGNIDAETFAVHRMTFMTDLAAAIGKVKNGKYDGRINYGEMDMPAKDCWAIWGLHFATMKELLHLSDYDKERHCAMTLRSACYRALKQSAPRFMDREARRQLDPNAEKSDIVCYSAAAFDASLLVYDVDDTDAVDNFCNDLDITEGQFYLPTFLLAASQAELSYEAHDGRLVPFMTCSIVTHMKLYGCSPPTTTARLRSFGNGTHPQNLLTCVTLAYPNEEKERNNRVFDFFFETQEFAPVRAMYAAVNRRPRTNIVFDWGLAMSDDMVEELQQCLQLGRIAGGLTISSAWAAELAVEELTDRQIRIVGQMYLQAHKHGLANDIPELQLALSAMMRERAEDQIASYGEKNGGMSRDAAASAMMRERAEDQIASYGEKNGGMSRDAAAGALMAHVRSFKSEEVSKETLAKQSKSGKEKKFSDAHRASLSKAATKRLEPKWKAMLGDLRVYKENNGDCLVLNPKDRSERRAAELRGDFPGWSQELASWVSKQRMRRKGDCSAGKKLTEKQVALLNELGFVWEIGVGKG